MGRHTATTLRSIAKPVYMLHVRADAPRARERTDAWTVCASERTLPISRVFAERALNSAQQRSTDANTKPHGNQQPAEGRGGNAWKNNEVDGGGDDNGDTTTHHGWCRASGR